MLSREDNELLCRVGPGTLMGDLIRQYWIPVTLTEELAAPDAPGLTCFGGIFRPCDLVGEAWECSRTSATGMAFDAANPNKSDAADQTTSGQNPNQASNRAAGTDQTTAPDNTREPAPTSTNAANGSR